MPLVRRLVVLMHLILRSRAAALGIATGSVLAASVALPATAGAATFTAEIDAPTSPALPGGRDIVGLSYAYDSAGRIEATIRLREAPAPGDSAVLSALQGTVVGTQCTNPSAAIGAPLGGGEATWEAPTGATGAAERGGSGGTVRLSTGTVPVAALAGLGQRCVIAFTRPAGATSGAEAYDASPAAVLRQVDDA
ncbi:hypothetical protein ACVU7I_05175, partial [Patulibacter sp. S7RM1-6]